MVNVIGEHNVQCETIRSHGGAVANHPQSLDADQRHHAGSKLSEGSPKFETAMRGDACALGDVEAIPPALTKAERAEEKLGMAMLREALHDHRIPNPPKWRQATALAQARRAQLTNERRERVKVYAEEGVFTVPQAAQLERVVQTTIRADCSLLNVRLRASAVKVTAYQEDISARRDRLQELAGTMITKQAAAIELGVSEATIRRDLMITRIRWSGGSR
mgnify:FL=1